MNSLTPDQAQALWKAGGFVVIADLPEGSEYGIDGVFHTTLSFSGTKFLPPGLHLITWSAPTAAPRKPALDTVSMAQGVDHGSLQGPGAIPLRQAMFLLSPPQGRYLLRYSPTTETLVLEKDAILSDDHLKSLDKSLAPYPFHAMEGWKKLSNRIGEQTLRRVLGEEWKVDGLTRVDGEVDEVDIPQRPVEGGDGGLERPKHQVEEPPLRFTLFDPKRSWREGAIGEEVTRYSKDKSWLLGDVLNRLHHEPSRLVAELQLAFILVLNLSSFGALQVFKRIVQITARASDIHLHPDRYITSTGNDQSSGRTIRQLYITFIQVVTAQLAALPEGVFDTELPELDIWLLGELDALRNNLREAVRPGVASAWSGEGNKGLQARSDVETAWDDLIKAGQRFRWELEPLCLRDTNCDEESEEEGEYAPVVVDM